MTLAQALQGMLKANLITLRDPPTNPNTTSSRYNPNARCAYHSDSPGHDTNDCWSLKNKIQDMIEAGEIEFEPPETPNVITAPMPNHDKTVNVVDDNSHITNVADLASPLLIIKKNLLQAGLFLGCAENCDLCILRPNDCLKLRNDMSLGRSIQRSQFSAQPGNKPACNNFFLMARRGDAKSATLEM